MGRAVRQFEKEVSFRLGTGVEYVASNCTGRTVRQFEKEVSFSYLFIYLKKKKRKKKKKKEAKTQKGWVQRE